MIVNAKTSGIIIGECSPEIRNTSITGCEDDGIEIYGGRPYIHDNDISGNGDGIMTYNGCDAIIEGNSITDNSGRGIGMIGDSEPTIINNHFENNDGKDIYSSKTRDRLILIFPIILVTGMIIPMFLHSYRKQKKALLEDYNKSKEEK